MRLPVTVISATMELREFNKMVRDWADKQPAQYRKTALAFGYRCDIETHSFDGTQEWIAKKSRERKGEDVSVSTIKRHLKTFKEQGVITEEKRRGDGAKNKSSIYTVDFGRFVEVGKRRNRESNVVYPERWNQDRTETSVPDDVPDSVASGNPIVREIDDAQAEALGMLAPDIDPDSGEICKCYGCYNGTRCLFMTETGVVLLRDTRKREGLPADLVAADAHDYMCCGCSKCYRFRKVNGNMKRLPLPGSDNSDPWDSWDEPWDTPPAV